MYGTWLDHCMSAHVFIRRPVNQMVSDTTDTNEWNGTDFWTTDRSRIFASHVLQPQGSSTTICLVFPPKYCIKAVLGPGKWLELQRLHKTCLNNWQM